MWREQDITWWLFTSICSTNVTSPLKLLPVVQAQMYELQSSDFRPEPGCCTFNFIHFETNETNCVLLALLHREPVKFTAER